MDSANERDRQLRFFFIVFTLSGFSGLIYESIWTHYLKLFLGHAAYAQALVLAVFMGGMALGALLCSRYSDRIGNLLLGYAAVEVVIGLCAILFHPFYVRFIDIAYATFIPAMNSPVTVGLFKWGAATVLILPQSILLGMTFPLMTAGVLRRFPQAPGSIIAMLYFTNSIGAAIGVLAAGFLFIGAVGLPGTLVIAGALNLLIAGAIYVEHKRGQPSGALPHLSRTAMPLATPPRKLYILSLLIAALTGFSSFIYEIGWIRMLSLVLGSSTHAFELMLSAFIAGLAFGGLWIKRRIDSFEDPRRFLAVVQVAMGVLAVLTLPLYGGTFNAMAWLVKTLPKTETGYLLFNLGSHGIAMIIMMPAAFCAGMTLPLITTVLLRSGTGERSIGTVYGFNTIGSILGVFTAIHLAMPLLGLKGMIILGAGIDIALGIGIAWWTYPSWRMPLAYSVLGAAALLVPALFVHLDTYKMASGVFRNGTFLNPGQGEIVYHRDGKTATVSVTNDSTHMSIRTNGKVDAGIQLVPPGHGPDEETMIMASAIGIAFRPEAETAAIIGWGSGLTTHTMLTNPRIKSVDTIEIEPEMIRAATLFGSRVRLAYDDPRSHAHIEDAKSFFSFHNRKYDLIISEPSNPWVSGVSSLFTREFYARIRNYLNGNGLFIQWMQLYEIDIQLVASVMKALSMHFSDYVIYAANSRDMLIIASPDRPLGPIDPSFLSQPSLARELDHVEVRNMTDVNVRLIGDRRSLEPLFASYGITANSDYAPVVDLFAVRSRYFGSRSVGLLVGPDLQRLPVIAMLGTRPMISDGRQLTDSPFLLTQKKLLSQTLFEYIVRGRWHAGNADLRKIPDDAGRKQEAIVAKAVLTRDCSEVLLNKEWWMSMLRTVAVLLPDLSRDQASALIGSIQPPHCSRQFTDAQRAFISLLQAVSTRDAAAMAKHASPLLEQIAKNPSQTDLLEYVLSAGMLGNIASGRTDEAGRLWQRYSRHLPDDRLDSLAIRLLVANVARMTPVN